MEPPCSSCDAAVVVAAPLFDDSTGGSNWCLQVCGVCRTLIEWRHEYTYLVNGASEDDTYVTRLDDAGARRALRQLFTRLRACPRSSHEPRTTLLPEAFDPVPTISTDQPGGVQRTYAMMELLQPRVRLPDDELDSTLELHSRFVVAGGAGGGWRTALSGAAELPTTVVFAFYGCPVGASAEHQAHLELTWLRPPQGRRLELPSANLLAARCVDEDLSGANLAGSMLVLADLSGASLRGALLVRADCSGARLVGCDLRDADLRGTDFERADLSGADLRGARLDGASFLDARTVGLRL
jgi:Pentapeptide repeats (8 copies)